MKKLYRNIALVTAIFMLALGAMLAVSYYQMRQVSPLESGVMQTLKEMNDSNADNESLQKQIRELDLISRKAYFVQEGQLKTGTYLLLGMACVLIVCLNLYFKESKNLPEKELDPIDEWMSKTKARKYLTIASIAALALTILFILLQHFNVKGSSGADDGTDSLAVANEDMLPADESDADAVVVASSDSIANDSVQAGAEDAANDSLPIPKITSKAFRGNNSSATSSARGIATSWNLKSKKNILWQSSIPKHGYNSPIISGRNVFITGADNSARELYCYDVYTGELKWTLKANNIPGSPSTMPKVNADTGLAASTAATNGEQVCAIFATGDIICADMEGNRLWAKNIGLPDNHYGYASSLLMYGNNVIIQYQNNGSSKIIALNAKTGNQSWSKSTSDKIAWSSPIIATLGGKSALVVMGNPAIAAYNPSNGSELWRVECMSGEVGSSPTSAGGIVYGASEYAKCIAINGATGETLWEASDYLPECSSLAATKNLVFCATSYGMVCAYDAQTGEVKKEHDLSTPFYSSPVVADGKVFLFSNSGKAYIFSSSTFDLITSFDTGEKTFATPAFTDGMMIVRTDKSIYCVKKN
ncbi:MAG: PQQ-like beta-propeller repeat protein [Bacteroidaceae bacterium]|nr:PQQ-like beta-propeller repeat protein [Bacteroidaceae bacterium]